MKILGIIKKVLIGILGVLFFAFAIVMTVLLLNYNDYGNTQFGNTTLVNIKEEISSKNYKKGDLVLVEAKKLDKIAVGNEIFAYKLDEKGKVHIDLGIVSETHPNDDAISFKNGSTYSTKFVIGEATRTYHDLGTYLAIVESKFGFLFIILVPSLLIFIYGIYALVVEIKYGKDEVLE